MASQFPVRAVIKTWAITPKQPATLIPIEERMVCELLNALRECAQIFPQALRIAIMKELFNLEMRALPDRNRAHNRGKNGREGDSKNSMMTMAGSPQAR